MGIVFDRKSEFEQSNDKKFRTERFHELHNQQRINQSTMYKTRVDGFIQAQALEKMPKVVIQDYRPPKQEFRAKDNHEKMLGQAVIRTKSFLSEKQRI